MPEHALDTASTNDNQTMPSNQVGSSIGDFSQSAETAQAAIVDQNPVEQLPNYADLYPPPPLNYQAVFTGSGKEYFKIWIVNLCLSLLSLGIIQLGQKLGDYNTLIATPNWQAPALIFTATQQRFCAVVSSPPFCYFYTTMSLAYPEDLRWFSHRYYFLAYHG